MTRDDIWLVALHVWEDYAQALSALSLSVDRKAFARCVQIIAGCKGRVVTAGVGTSAAAARKIAHSLSCIERPSFFLSPTDAVHGALGAVQPEDVAVLISKGGGSQEIINILPALKTKRVFIIGVTEKQDSILSRESDLFMRVAVEKEADPFNMLATTSTVAIIAVFDAVCIALMQYTGYTREQFAVIHPAGAVGQRLTSKNS